MNDTTELIQAIAQQVMTVVQAALSQRAEARATMNLASVDHNERVEKRRT